MATTKTSKSNRLALLPANVPGIVRELHHLAAVPNAAATSKPREGRGPANWRRFPGPMAN